MKRMLESGWFWGIVTGLVFIFLLVHWCNKASAQNVIQQGNMFVQGSSSKIKKDNPTLTKYTYVVDGVSYPIYMSANGKCFIIRTSSKTGKKYKQYLPEITKILKGKI